MNLKLSNFFKLFTIMAILLSTVGCSRKRAPLGTAKNPVKIYFVPSVDAKVIEDRSKVIKEYLEANTPYKFKVGMPSSYIAVVEAFGTARADMAALNTFSYILAHEKYNAKARLMLERYGQLTYQSQIIARADSGIKTLKDLNGKKIAFVDPSSTSGYILPQKMFKDAKVKPSDVVFASRHDNVVSMIYQKQVDAGATYYSPPEKGEIQDARKRVKTQYPDIEAKVKIIKLSEHVPNDPIVFREGMPEEMVGKITAALKNFMSSESGKKAFYDIYTATGIAEAKDTDYDIVRDMLKAAGVTAHNLIKDKK